MAELLNMAFLMFRGIKMFVFWIFFLRGCISDDLFVYSCFGNKPLLVAAVSCRPTGPLSTQRQNERYFAGDFFILKCISLQWRHNERDGVSSHRCLDCVLNRLLRRRSKKTSKLRTTGLCEGNSPVTGEFPAQRPVTRKMFPFDDVIMSLMKMFVVWSIPHTVIRSQGSNQQKVTIGSENGLVPIRLQSIVGTNDGLVLSQICVTRSQ